MPPYSYICIMKKYNLIVAALAFLICALAAYFGTRVHNANENFLLTELNEFDKIYYDDITLVPKLNRLAAIVTAPLILGILFLEVMVIRTAMVRQSKNIAIGLFIATAIIAVFDVLTLLSPEDYDFSHFGFIWICLGLFLLVGNVLSYFITRFSTSNR
jgi:hypothetical protein